MALLDRVKLESNSEGNPEDNQEGLLAPDPVPDEKPATRRKPAGKAQTRKPPAPRAKSTSTMAKEVAEDLATFGELLAATVSMRDDVCGPALEANVRPIVTAFVAILERNPRLLAKFADFENATMIMLVVGLIRACAPVATAIYSHHGPGSAARHGDHEAPDEPAVDPELYPTFSGVRRGHPA